jgi:glycosyltransferase involved in cell wall biosynthesis
MPEESDEPASELPPAARGKIVVGYFGRFSIEKGPDLFVDIVRRLAANPHLFFVMAGAGPEFDRVLRQIRKHRLQERIYTPGFVVPVTPLMRAADIVVLPSRIDGMPQVVLEAQAMGKPVVASRVGSLPLMIEDEKTGFLCEIGDLDAFSKQILKLAGDKDLRDRMKIAAQESIRMKFSADRMLESYERVFRTVSSTTK